MLFLWAASGVPFGVYFIVQSANIALRIQPQLFMLLSIVAFLQSLYYPPVGLRYQTVLKMGALLVVVFASLEAALVLALKPLYRSGTTWPNLMVGIIAGILLAVGLLPAYPELFKRRGRVEGINFVFLTLDTLGAIFSMLSVYFEPGETDVLGMVLYAVVLALESGIFLSHVSWMLRVRYFDLVEKHEEYNLVPGE